MTRLQSWILVGCGVIVTAGIWMVCAELASTIRGVSTAMVSVTGTVDRVPELVIAEVKRQGDAVRKDARAEIHATVGILDSRIAKSTAVVSTVAESQLKQIATDVLQLRKDVRPILVALPPAIGSLQATSDELRASWQDLYWDTKAMVESATVTARGVAESAEAVGKAAPAITAAITQNGQNIAGITADIHVVTSKFVTPRTKKQKVWDLFKFGAVVGTRIIP